MGGYTYIEAFDIPLFNINVANNQFTPIVKTHTTANSNYYIYGFIDNTFVKVNYNSDGSYISTNIAQFT